VNRRFVVRRPAEKEIEAALEWYESERPGLGVKLAVELEKTFKDLFHRPEAWPLWQPEYPYRKRPMERFPYVIFYRVTETEVRVLAVAHAKRKPGYWTRRK
jgi:plasmid stabilization system protein ParE